MNRKDKQIFDMLENKLKSEAENIDVPLRLQKESIVKMLETQSAEKSETTASSDRNNIFIIRKAMAIAAMLVIVVAGALLMKPQSDVKVVRADTFNEKFKDASPVRSVESIEDVEKAVREILDDSKTGGENKPIAPSSRPATPENNVGVTDVSSAESENIFESYSGYIASAKLENNGRNETKAEYGEFKADIVKTDGKHLYIASTGTDIATGDTVEQIRIVGISDDGSMEAVSTIVLSEGAVRGSFDECIELHLDGNRLVAIMKRHNYAFDGSDNVYDNASIIAVYYDITEPSAPVKIREHIQDGEYISSALYENKFSLVTAKPITDRFGENGISVPSFSIDGENVKLGAEDICIAVNDPDNSYLFVTVTDITDFTKGVGRFALLGCGDKIYCGSSAVVAVREFASQEEDENGIRNTFTEVHKINLEGLTVGYSGWYRLGGSLEGNVSVDEESGYLRALTSDGKTNRLYVLDKDMQFVIALDIFKGEKVSGVNFVGNNCYVVSESENGAKTAVIDFSVPDSPKLSGTVSEKIFSSDFYEASATQLIGISESKLESVGEESVFMPLKVTLFDIGDSENPKTASVYTFGESFRSVASDSRSIMIDKEKKLIGIPVLKTDSESGSRISEYALFDFSAGELEAVGTYTHSLVGDAAVRGICVGDIFYTVSGDKVVAFDINTDSSSVGKLAEFPLN